MTNERLAPRRAFTETERAIYVALATLAWRSGSLDLDFLQHLSRRSVISEKQSRRLHKIAHTRWIELPLNVRDRLSPAKGIADDPESLCADPLTVDRYLARRDTHR